MNAVARLALTCGALLPLAGPARAQRVAEVQVAPPYVQMILDAEVQLVGTAFDDDGNPIVRLARHEWRSSNINVVQVDPRGTLRAIAPGTAVVTFRATAGGRTRYGRTWVTVLAPGQQPGHVAPVLPPPPVARVPRVPSPDAPAPPMAPRVPTIRLDSIVRANVNCEDPFTNSINPARACYETPPTTRARPATLLPPPASCGLRPSPARLLVLVDTNGDVREVRTFVGSTCADFTAFATARTRDFSFEPARRDGRPVRAWTMVVIRPEVPDPNSAQRP